MRFIVNVALRNKVANSSILANHLRNILSLKCTMCMFTFSLSEWVWNDYLRLRSTESCFSFQMAASSSSVLFCMAFADPASSFTVLGRALPVSLLSFNRTVTYGPDRSWQGETHSQAVAKSRWDRMSCGQRYKNKRLLMFVSRPTGSL